MIRKKITLLGASAVGKTSLVSRYVYSSFSDVYRTTIGVQIERKQLFVAGDQLELILWDLEGEDAYAQVQLSYVRGSHGYVLVVDGTRRATLEAALDLDARVRPVVGSVPRAVLINKRDLEPKWEVTSSDVRRLTASGFAVHLCSAKTGAGVEEAMNALAARVLEMPLSLQDALRHE